LTTGRGECAQSGTTSSTEFYCNFPNCNNFGPVSGSPSGVGWTCFDPLTASTSACTSSQWQCQTTTAGVGSCVGTKASLSYYSCATEPNCNVISSCFNPETGSTITCDSPYATRACEVTISRFM
jgi:hypothetical protein